MVEHRAYGGRNKERDNVWWHGSVSGDMRGGKTGLHLGTRAAAEDALHATIGFPVEGAWDGTRDYYKTLLAGKKRIKAMDPYGITGRNVDAPDEDYYAHEHPKGILKYSNGDPVPMDVKPSIKPFRITGNMTNTIDRPHGDFKANGYMQAALKKGNAKNGYFYKNDAEDYGSISAVVPGPEHIQPVDEADITKAEGGEVDEPGITAYHGSPHDFERFDTSKIGTGEGAQAYGHGLYFAENPAVAKSYRPIASENKPVPITVDGEKFENPTAMQKLVAQHRGNVDAVHKAMSPHWERAALAFQSAPQDPDDLAYMLAEDDHQQALAQKAELEGLRGKKVEHDYSGHHQGHALAGHSYEVYINSHPDHFLDWDAPLNQQTGRVKRFLELSSKLDGKPIENITGEQWLKNLGVQFLQEGAKNPSAAISEHLKRQGISGIKYLDQGSRSSEHKGTRNYVVFDDKLVNVKRKYAKGGIVQGGSPIHALHLTSKFGNSLQSAVNQAKAATRRRP